MAGECRLPGINLDQHNSILLCAFVHAVGGFVGFALPYMCLLLQNGATALALASQNDHINVVRFLLESGAQVNKV